MTPDRGHLITIDAFRKFPISKQVRRVANCPTAGLLVFKRAVHGENENRAHRMVDTIVCFFNYFGIFIPTAHIPSTLSLLRWNSQPQFNIILLLILRWWPQPSSAYHFNNRHAPFSDPSPIAVTPSAYPISKHQSSSRSYVHATNTVI